MNNPIFNLLALLSILFASGAIGAQEPRPAPILGVPFSGTNQQYFNSSDPVPVRNFNSVQGGFPANRPPGSTWQNEEAEAAKRINETNAIVNTLIEKLKRAESDEDKQDLKDQLNTQLGKQYDLYLERHEKPLIELEARLEKLREEFDWRKSARDDLVKLRLDTIWYNSQGLGWPGGQIPVAPMTYPVPNTGPMSSVPLESSFDRYQTRRAVMPTPETSAENKSATAKNSEDQPSGMVESRDPANNRGFQSTNLRLSGNPLLVPSAPPAISNEDESGMDVLERLRNAFRLR